MMVLVKVFTIPFLLTVCRGDGAMTYTAAVVEYATPYTPSLSADEVLIRNAATYVEYMTNASLHQVDIIVFPEDGMSHNNANKAIEVPSPNHGIAPCDENTTFHQALVTLSCASRSQGLYTVINLKEIYYNTSTNETSWYNTNVAFDRNGTVVGRYRKYNPYGESVNRTATPEYSVFKTDFGVDFGMFTCFDIDFEEPALVLARELGVHHFVFPNCWDSELPFLTAVQTQWGWSFSLNVVLLAAGCNDPSAGGSGSGIYTGEQSIQTYVQTNSHTSKMIIATLPTRSNSSGNNTEPTMRTMKTKLIENKPVNVNSYFKTESLSESSGSGSNSSLVVLRDYLDVYQTKLLIDPDELTGVNTTLSDNSTINLTLTSSVTLCQNELCCDFQVEVIGVFSTTPPAQTTRGDDFSRHIYKLAVFDGVRSYGGGVATGGVQVCGIIPCLNDSLSSCGLRADTPQPPPQPYIGNLYKVSTIFKRIGISASFYYNNTFIFPSVLVMGEHDEFGRLPQQGDVLFEKYEPFNASSLCGLWMNKTIPNLVSAAVYARQFDRDGEPRTEASRAEPLAASHKILILVVFLLRFQV